LKQDDASLAEYLKSAYLHPPSREEYNLSTDPIYKNQRHAFSWNFIHRHLISLFGNQTGGFFVEAGALDGEFLSTSLYFEQNLNWTGLLIEPNPDSYKELKMKNRKAWSSNTCISSTPYLSTIVLIALQKNETAPKDALDLNPWVYRGSSYESHITIPLGKAYERFMSKTVGTNVTVKCFPLFTYLSVLNKTMVDFITLDIQGTEKDVIKYFPFDKIDVKVFVIEHIPPTKYLDSDLETFMITKGYQLIACGAEPDYIYVSRKAFPDIKFPTVDECEYH
ncbi:UNVERIFIED_CONTAM: hypothetical protein GTU68_020479, partial [Idotea baltica]|nr:hypothetical protein [Idotea baltica]